MGNFLKNLHPLLRRGKNQKDNQDPNYALIDTLNDEMNMVEREMIESKLQSSLKTATTEYLDKFGGWFGVYRRTDENDEDYRARIIRYLLLKRGTNNAIIDAIRDYLDKDDIDVDVYEPFTNIFYTNKSHLNGEDHLMGYYYRFAVINVSIGDYFPVEIIDIINEFKPAGVTLYVTYDGASTIKGSAIIKWLEDLPKVETYQEYDRFTGYDDTFYGHINMNESKNSDSVATDVFRTNNSLTNSLDVLTGSSSIGRQYVNYSFLTSYAYSPNMDSFVNSISSVLGGRGSEVISDYYMYTSVKNNNLVELELETSSGVSYLYNNFNFRDYMSKYRPGVNIQTEEARKIVSDYIGELSIDYYLSAVIPPDEEITVRLQVYDFSTNKWATVAENSLSFYEENIGENIGYTKDYLNNELNMFTRVEVNAGKRNNINLKVNYLDLTFYYYERGLYTIKPYSAIVDNYLNITRESFIEAFKVASLSNGDIISKSGYQPIRYLRVAGDVDNLQDHLVITTISTNTEEIPSTRVDEDTRSFILDYGNGKTNIHNFNLMSDIDIPNLTLQYSSYADAWEDVKTLNNLPAGETSIDNKLKDLYGLQTIDYSNITPMSRVSLRSVWDVKIGDINNQEGTLSNMSNNFFNAVWQETDIISSINLDTLSVVKDTEGGVFDGASGEIIKATPLTVNVYTDLDKLSYTVNHYTEPVSLSSSRLISELREELLTVENIEIDNRIKVVETISEQIPITEET